MKALTAAQMREVDRLSTSRYGIPSQQLMEAAGQSVARAILRAIGPEFSAESGHGVPISILCGKGNNGGDGLVAARHLKVAGVESQVYFFGDPAKVSGDAGENLQRWQHAGGAINVVNDEQAWIKVFPRIAESYAVVDALFGTGLRGALTGLAAKAVIDVNALSRNATAARPALILAVDMPSGLPSDGEAAEGAVLRAHQTVTFTGPKVGQLVSRDAAATGVMEVHAIGSPPEVVEELGDENLRWVSVDEFAGLPLVRAADANKGTFGHVLLVAGAIGKSGAAVLAGRMAVRSGAGLVTIATPAPALPIIAAGLAEYMTIPVAATRGGTLAAKSVQGVNWKKIEKGKTVLGIGPGLSTEPQTQSAIRALIKGTDLPIVLDADGLNAFEGRADDLRKRKSKFLAITPHPGEMARLLGRSGSEVQNDRRAAAIEAAKRWGAHVILKGFHTIIASPQGQLFVNTTGNAGLAKGGTGDVLTGLLAALTAQFKTDDWLRILSLGVYLHGLAADIALQGEMDASGLIADDVAALIPKARKQLLRELRKLG
jgi:ADP-dependent NAD(P)H-hydrate dehydratase / NAD(P)H-hydrate epimerase